MPLYEFKAEDGSTMEAIFPHDKCPSMVHRPDQPGKEYHRVRFPGSDFRLAGGGWSGDGLFW